MFLALAAVDLPSATPSREASTSGAVQVVRDYYAAVSRHDYRRAYVIWHGKQSYRQFRDGYRRTARVKVVPLPPFHIEGAAGSLYADIPVKVDAQLLSGAHQHFVGSYTLRRINNVPGSTAAQRHWHIESARLKQVPAGH